MTSCFCCTPFHWNSKTHVFAFAAVLPFNSFPLALLRPNLSKISSVLLLKVVHGCVVAAQFFKQPQSHFGIFCTAIIFSLAPPLNIIWTFTVCSSTACLYFRRGLAEICSSLFHYTVQSKLLSQDEWDRQTVVTNTQLLSLFFFQPLFIFFFSNSSHWHPELFCLLVSMMASRNSFRPLLSLSLCLDRCVRLPSGK